MEDKGLAKQREQGGASIRVYIVEGTGCGACALEAQAALAASYGAIHGRVVAVEAPAHADVLVLCGPLPTPLAEEAGRLAEELVEPWACVRLGDCGEGEVVAGRVMVVAGCPPTPEAILAAVRAAWKAPYGPIPTAAEPRAEEEQR